MSQVYRFGDCELDQQRYQLRRGGIAVELEPKVFEVLAYLIRERDRVVSKRELLDELWPDRVVGEWSLTRCISLVRKAVQDNPTRQSVIQTVYGRGYRFVADTAEAAEAPGLVRALPEPPEAAGRPRSFIGRASELAELGASLEAAFSGRGQLALVVGENGVGKTRLAEELARLAEQRGASVRLARCWEAEGAPAFWPWIQIVREEIRARGAAHLRLLMGAGAGEIARIVPDLRSELPDLAEPAPLEARQERFLVFDALTSFFKNASREQPLLLVLDDLQRADPASLRLLEFLGREIGAAHLLIVGTYGEAELLRDAGRARLVAQLARACSAKHVQLQGLPAADVARFVHASTGATPDGDAIEKLHRHTGGNPFFLEQILGVLSGEEISAWIADPGRARPLPQGVRHTILRQLDGLPESCRELLTVAAVVGRRFSLEVVGHAAGLDEAKLRELFGEAERAGIVVAGRPRASHLEFVHGLVRDTLYAELASGDRASWHARVGDALERRPGAIESEQLAELAYHHGEAVSLGHEKKALEYAVAAGHSAIERVAYDEACQLFERAIELVEGIDSVDEALRCDLLLSLGDAQLRSRERHRAAESLQEASRIARRIEDPERLARAALGAAHGSMPLARGVVEERVVALLEEALEALDERDDPLRALVLASLATALYWAGVPERVAQLREQALEMARRLGDPSTLLTVLSAAIVTGIGPDLVQERVELSHEAVRLGERAGVKQELLDARVLRLIGWFELGELDTFDEELVKISNLTAQMQQPEAQEYVPFFRAMRAMMSGRFEISERLVDEFLSRVQRSQDETGMVGFWLHVMMLRFLQGSLEEALEIARQLADQHPAASVFRCMLARLYCDLDQPALARGEVERLGGGEFRGLTKNVGWLTSVAFLAEACARLGDERRCALLYDLLAPYSLRHATSGATMYAGSVSRYLGLLATALARQDIAGRHFATALAMETRLDARPWLAWTRYDYARLRLLRGRDGDRAEAEALAARALQTARELGMAGLERRVLALH